MSKRVPHYLDYVKSARTPSQIVSIDARLDGEKRSAWYAIFERREGGKWTRHKEASGSTPEEFWRTLWGWSSPDRATWVVSVQWGRVGDAVDLVTETTETSTQVGKVILSEKIVHIELSRKNRKIELIDARNWWSDLPDWVAPREYQSLQIADSTALTARNLHKLVTGMIDMAVSHNLGSPQPTSGAWSSNVWRSWHRGKRVVVHADEVALKLEREAYFGGQVIVRRVGKLQGPYYGVDVNMMYPAAMSGIPMPRRLVDYQERYDPATLLAFPANYGAISRVLIESPNVVYPKRLNDKMVCATGEFWTVLAWPELSLAIELGHVREVSATAVYELTDLFGLWGRNVWCIRSKLASEGEKHYARLVKQLSVALHGKLGQHAVDWVDVDEPCVAPWSWWLHAEPLKPPTRRRAIGWQVQEKRNSEEEPFNSFPAIAAWTTSQSRVHMSLLRSIAGSHSWVYQYTDTLVVDQAGYASLILHGQIDPDTIGKCKLDWSCDTLEIRGPGWIMHDDRRRASGIGQTAVEDSANQYLVQTETSLAGLIGKSGPNHYSQVKRSIHYPPSECVGIKLPDGWIDPPHLGQEMSGIDMP